MKEFLEALAITLAFVLGGYALFGSLGNTQANTETMDMESADMPAESPVPMKGMKSIHGMDHSQM